MEAKIVESPAEFPGVDYLTGSAVGPFVDTGVYVTHKETGRRFGRIYLSKATVLALAEMFGEGLRGPSSEDYARGYFDALKEDTRGTLDATARDLRRALDIIAPVADPPVPAESDQ